MLKSGNENFTFDDKLTDFQLNDFWKWQASDLLNNTLRGALAEFIVAKALNINTNIPREDWNEYDLLFGGKYKIEIKASAYIQSWEQKQNSKIIFSISPSRAWDSSVGYSEDPKRHSDLYVFCLFAEKDREKANPLILDKWEFYPVLTMELNKCFQQQKTIGISSIKRLCPKPCNYHSLCNTVEKLLIIKDE